MLNAPDQLRQRVAWALATVFIVSDQGITNYMYTEIPPHSGTHNNGEMPHNLGSDAPRGPPNIREPRGQSVLFGDKSILPAF